ncbi:MAG: MBL fold metallo-hydrolase [Metallosphaera yellowstonensis]|jgi:putative mRNA 3-end processing factor|uniref:Putative exonuclease of the beta-lactamase fold involved in RNA processing n=1 Tax=Metallosphaera yellowstonensis MK1 TaxID=671065 RepID=H2C812_9CREN|nr:MBL fold metallo-hydrolase [Metallosphaera yellowstonensis]EHP68288.1 putative exonuclease of the beta-lactamase fold involved in RNA processing [Metallosphaera yellowstonensis MK1]
MQYTVKILGGGQEVGRAGIEISNSSESIILDYGVNFNQKDEPNFPLQESPSKVSGFVISHAHLDHIGALPIYQISTTKKIYGTGITKYITELMLKDFIKLSGQKVPFEWVEVKKTMDNFETFNYWQETEIGPFTVSTSSAGHIPGSAITVVKTEKGDIAYTGDINVTNAKLVRPAEVEIMKKSKVIITEATYGKFNHPPRSEVEEEFYKSVMEVLEGGGTVLVPAFSLSRSQEILAVLAKYKIPYPVYYDGMARTIMEIMMNNPQYINDTDALRKAYEEFHYVKGWEDRSRAWRNNAVIVASAGMLKGGPAVYYYKKIADNPKNAIFLVSYQAENTPGRRLLEIGKFDEGSPLLKARLQMFDFSSHAGRNQLIDIIKTSENLEKLIIVHASPDSAQSFSSLVKERFGVEVLVPENGQEIQV